VSLHAIEPGLLLAAPSLGDPNFEGTVVLLGMHKDDEGSLGWIVNGDVIEDAATIVRGTGLASASDPLPEGFTKPALRGGPVTRTSVWVLYRPEGELLPKSISVNPDIAVTPAAEALQMLIAGEGPQEFRLVLGYAGWGPGQLAKEMSQGAWLPAKATPDLVFGDTQTLWRRAYAETIGTIPTAFVSGTRGSA
jgi:putative transcriptional regulator